MTTATKTSLRRRVTAAIFTGAIGPALALTAALASPEAVAAQKVSKADCRVHAVLAKHDPAKKKRTVPKNLNFLQEELMSPAFAAFNDFRLLGTTPLKLKSLNETVNTKLASGHGLSMSLLSGDTHRLKLHIKLGRLKGTKPLLAADYTIDSDGFLLLAASHPDGSVVVAVQCHGQAA